MKNYIQQGATITLTAPYSATSGSGMLVGSIFGIACNDVLIGSEVEVKLTGVFTMQKVTTETWKVGDLIYWHDTDKLATVTTNSHLVGVAVASSSNPSSIGTVRLNGSFSAHNIVTGKLVYNDQV